MTITRFLFILFVVLNAQSCKDNSQDKDGLSFKKNRINFIMNDHIIPEDILKTKLNLPYNKIQKLERIHEKYKDLLRNANPNESMKDLRRRKEFEIKILLGDSLKVEYDKLVLSQGAFLEKRKK